MKIVATSKKKKLLIGAICLAVAGGGAVVLVGADQTPAVAPPPSAKAALAEAQAKLANGNASHAKTPAGIAASPSPAVVARPAPAAATSAASPHTATAAPVVEPIKAASVAAAPAPVAPSTVATPVAASAPVPAAAPVSTAAPAPAAAAVPVQSAGALAAAEAARVSTDYNHTGYYESLADLQRQVSVMELRAKIADLKHKIDGDGDASRFPPPASPVAVMPPPSLSGGSESVLSLASPSAKAESSSRTALVSVMMVAGQYQAVMRSGGADLTVRNGSMLSDGWMVSSIGPADVSLVRGRQHKTVRIGG